MTGENFDISEELSEIESTVSREFKNLKTIVELTFIFEFPQRFLKKLRLIVK